MESSAHQHQTQIDKLRNEINYLRKEATDLMKAQM
jgi:hypothetical protein